MGKTTPELLTRGVEEIIGQEDLESRLASKEPLRIKLGVDPTSPNIHIGRSIPLLKLGGIDQRFNILAGRTLQKHYSQRPQAVILNPLIEGLDGRKMSSSWGNTINLMDSPRDMFGKLMSLRDEFIIKYFELLTRIPMETIKEYETELKQGANPRDIKLQLAKALVTQYHSKEAAESEEKYFMATFSKKEVPDDMPTVSPGSHNLVPVLVETKLANSTSDARRVIRQKGVKVNGEVVTNLAYVVPAGSVLQKGKLGFVKVL